MAVPTVRAPADAAFTLTKAFKRHSRSTLCVEDEDYSRRPLTPSPSPSATTTTPPLNARKLDKNVYPTAANRNNILDPDPIYLYHPSHRQDLQAHSLSPH